MTERSGFSNWLDIGDLHITKAGEENNRDLLSIVRLAQGLPSGSVDFAVLPGNSADNNTRGQFTLCAVGRVGACHGQGRTGEDHVEPASQGWTPPRL